MSWVSLGNGGCGREPHCPAALFNCAVGPHVEKTRFLEDTCQSVENFQAPRYVSLQKAILAQEGTLDTMYPAGWSKMAWVVLNYSLQFGALSGRLGYIISLPKFVLSSAGKWELSLNLFTWGFSVEIIAHPLKFLKR